MVAVLDCANYASSHGVPSPCPKSVFFKNDTLPCSELKPLAISTGTSLEDAFLESLRASEAAAACNARFSFCNHCRLHRVATGVHRHDRASPSESPVTLKRPRQPLIARTPPLLLLPLTITTIAGLTAVPLRLSFSDEPATSKLFAALDPSLKCTITPPYGITDHLNYRMSSFVVTSASGARLEVVLKDADTKTTSVSVSLYASGADSEALATHESTMSISAHDVHVGSVSTILDNVPLALAHDIVNCLGASFGQDSGCTAVCGYTSVLVTKLARAVAASAVRVGPVTVHASSSAPDASDQSRLKEVLEKEKRYA